MFLPLGFRQDRTKCAKTPADWPANFDRIAACSLSHQAEYVTHIQIDPYFAAAHPESALKTSPNLGLDGKHRHVFLIGGQTDNTCSRLKKIELEEAIQLDRNYSTAINQLGIVLNFLGQPEAAVPTVERAIRLDPQASNIEVFYWNLGNCHLLLGHIDKSADLFRKALAANPRPAYPHLWLAAALGLKGDIDEAHARLAAAIRIRPAWDTLTHFLADCTYCGFGNPQYRALAEKTLLLGLRRAGLPDE
jgi:tetratricopeptide (TPR) repeat protein